MRRRRAIATGTRASTVELGFLAGVINGDAPLYERFVLGDSTTLRGWNKFDLDPLGGSHVVHGSIDYRYRFAGFLRYRRGLGPRPGTRTETIRRRGIQEGGFSARRGFPAARGPCRSDLLCGYEFLKRVHVLRRNRPVLNGRGSLLRL